MDRLSDLTEKMRQLEARSDFLRLAWLHGKYGSAVGPLELAEKAAQHFGRASRIAETMLKTAVAPGDTTTSGWASELVYPGLTGEWTSALSGRTILGKLPFRRVGLNTRTLKETTAGTAAWVAAGAPAPVASMSLDVTSLEAAKVVALVPFTGEVVDSWTPATAANINAALMSVVSRFLDYALLNPDIAAVVGKNPASLTNGITPHTTSGSTESDVLADVAAMLQSLSDAGSDLNDVQIAMHPTTAVFLATALTGPNSNLGARGGELLGVPVSTTVGAVCSGSPTEKIIACIDPTRCLLADDGVTAIASSRVASLQMSDAPSGAAQHVSMYQTGTVALRLTRYLNFERAHASAAAFMRVTY